ncbi:MULTISPECIES: sulfatase [unclassified Lentimonas]|uniref:sulfatase n=1 Tax=unclassified Lentimonas TaxID=2630993 RepID=UPI00132871F6|nr:MULTISPECIES: sulfatase [unclassified Lentimonas]CAA6677610.1 Choline-sulfatase (EC [Lentimonas sp. CC4]CAA6684292.1 Choline-sulfatase (EC [Lentimonas sp. CC6]CAA7078192.1 Choline-sulfatase (EC [Lentimonas sp. CC4]CAA7168292.1 Choline-sulfatase (EC [Lentimonas sp. CC21]CAA7181874.1 Choline-sulfatase (EC [Lentimonas sp. CC8]
MYRPLKNLLTLSAFVLSTIVSAQTTRPNVLIFFIDDLGWTDLGVNGSTFHETPHIDALAASGVNFKRSYSANPVCSPTRAALMTGKAPQRVGITQWIPTRSKIALPLSEVTIGEAFQEAGYRTGYIGKWHLGKEDSKQPQYQGFEYTKAVNRAGQPASFFYPFGKRKGGSSVPDLQNYKPGDYLTDALTDLAIEFIDQGSPATDSGQANEPFFLCLAHYAVHTPIQAPKPLIQKYEAKKRELLGEGKLKLTEEKYNTRSTAVQGDPAYAAMMENLDNNIGRVMDHLKAKGLLEDTIIVFSSDNGGLAHRKQTGGPTSNAPLRSGKAFTYEGGVRIPTMISWVGNIQPATTEAPIITMDLYPTLLDLAGLPLKPEQHLDGQSLKPILGGTDSNTSRVLAWTYPHEHGNGHKPSDSILNKDWKLIRFEGNEPSELYNLSTDIGEQTNLAKQNPEKVKDLEKQLDAWLETTK